MRSSQSRIWLMVAVMAGVLASTFFYVQKQDLIHYASFGTVDQVKRLLDAGANPNERIALRDATPGPSLRQRLNDWMAGTAPLRKPRSEMTPLSAAVLSNRDRGARERGGVIRLLLERGADPNGSGVGPTPLMLASLHGDTEAVQILLEHGADVNKADESGVTPLKNARSHPDVAALLEKAGATR